jgi:hypothetical protein
MPQFSVVIPVSKVMTARRNLVLHWVIDRWSGYWDENQLQIILGTDDSEPFNRAKARNVGLAQVKTEHVVIADGDTAFDPPAIDEGLERLSDIPWIVPYGDNEYYNLTQEYTETIMDYPLDALINPVWDFRVQSWAGLLIARTEDCLNVGYDERFKGWGWEDVAFRVKMDAEVGKHGRISHGRALHLWHSREGADFGTPEELANRIIFDEEYRRKYNWRDERIR